MKVVIGELYKRLQMCGITPQRTTRTEGYEQRLLIKVLHSFILLQMCVLLKCIFELFAVRIIDYYQFLEGFVCLFLLKSWSLLEHFIRITSTERGQMLGIIRKRFREKLLEMIHSILLYFMGFLMSNLGICKFTSHHFVYYNANF